MKLGTLKCKESLDGDLVVVSRDNQRAVKAQHIAPHLRHAVEHWSEVSPKLTAMYNDLNSGKIDGFAVDEEKFHSPLPRAFAWIDGSVFINHIKLVRMARNAPLPETLYTRPLIYQGGSDTFLAPREVITQVDENHGTDFEGEIGIISSFVPMGTSAQDALQHIRLFVLINDVSLRGLALTELAQGFGFFQSKPSSAFAPFAVTEDELGGAFRNGRVHLPLNVDYNGKVFGRANASEMHFHFGEVMAHAAYTRHLGAGTIIGSGTVSNEDRTKGSSCIVEKRMIEKIDKGEIQTPFMRVGDTVKIEMLDAKGKNIFGTILQKVISAPRILGQGL